VTDRSLPHVALSAHAHNRLGLQRTDEAWLERTWADESTRVLVISGSRLRPIEGEIRWVPPSQAPAGTRILLGERSGVTYFAVIVHPAKAPGAREEWVPLRAVLPWLAQAAPDQAPFLFHAIGLAEWHHATRFCPRCGGRMESIAAGHELRCEACQRPQFPRSDPAVIMAITHPDDDALLLGRQTAWPEKRWSTLAGFCEPGETLEDAVRREVGEETNVAVGEVTYFGSQPWPFPSSLMVGFTGRATSRAIEVDGAEVAQARWWTREEFLAAADRGELQVPRGVSISSSLIEAWLGRPIEHGWG
jgi:NAD+ diphosphatase